MAASVCRWSAGSGKRARDFGNDCEFFCWIRWAAEAHFWFVSQGQTGEICSQWHFVISAHSLYFWLMRLLIVSLSISSLIHSFIHHFLSNSTSLPLKAQPSVWMSSSCFGSRSCLYRNVLSVCVCRCNLPEWVWFTLNILSDNIYLCSEVWLSPALLHSGAQPLFSLKLMDTCCLITAVLHNEASCWSWRTYFLVNSNNQTERSPTSTQQREENSILRSHKIT